MNMEEEKKAEEEDEEKEDEEEDDEVKGDARSSLRCGLSRNLPRVLCPRSAREQGKINSKLELTSIHEAAEA